MTPRTGAARLDILAPAILVAGAVAYVSCLPAALYHPDESAFLFMAVRLLRGEHMYRDVFDMIMPGAHYVTAALFDLFGTTIRTVRVADGVLHGLVMALVWLSARAVGVRPVLAAVAALMDLAVFRPAWPVASAHWYSSLLNALLVLVLLVRPRPFLAGVVAGLMVAVQQQRAIPMAIGVATLFVAQHAIVPQERSLGRQIVALGAGIGVLVVPLLAFVVLRAGLEPVYDALVVQPLFRYASAHRVVESMRQRFGSLGWYSSLAADTAPRLLSGLCLAVPVAGLRAVWDASRRRDDPERARRSLVLAVIGAAAIVSILYYPDFIHLALIGPVLAVVAADAVEGGIAALGRQTRIADVVSVAVAMVVLAAMAVHLGGVMVGSWRTYPVSRDTPFGTVSFRSDAQGDLYARVRAEMQAAGAREMFVYPTGSDWYLLTGATNPTPYQLLMPGISSPEQFRRTIDILERRKVPFIAIDPLVPQEGDTLAPYVRTHYVRSSIFPLLLRRVPPDGAPGS